MLFTKDGKKGANAAAAGRPGNPNVFPLPLMSPPGSPRAISPPATENPAIREGQKPPYLARRPCAVPNGTPERAPVPVLAAG